MLKITDTRLSARIRPILWRRSIPTDDMTAISLFLWKKQMVILLKTPMDAMIIAR